ncbi:MAG: hypothetical protein M1817_003626 [Caeruleum heppii]|nr:MAG: hypothetical protein M1817_003626 [Caeruleum heppii]
MALQVSEDQLGQAVLDSVRHGSYPESEHIISAQLPPTAFAAVLREIESARGDVEDDLRKLSRESATDIDGWIAQAKHLHADIEQSKATAHEILEHARQEKDLRDQLQDAANKRTLLDVELAFNASLIRILEEYHSITNLLDHAETSINESDPMTAIELSNRASDVLDDYPKLGSTTFVDLFRQRIAELRGRLLQGLEPRWEQMIHASMEERQITLKSTSGDSPQYDLEVISTALDQLHRLSPKIDSLAQDIDRGVLSSLLKSGPDKTVASFVIERDTLRITGRSPPMSLRALLPQIQSLINFLHSHLTPRIRAGLSDILLPKLTDRLIADWLSPEVPISLEGMENFREILSLVKGFCKSIEALGWRGSSSLVTWTNDAPRVWLTRRREASLDALRELLANGLGEKKSVERVETQKVAKEEAILAHNGVDEWDANWSDEEEQKEMSQPSRTQDEDDDPAEAWGLDEDVNDESEHQLQAELTTNGEPKDGQHVEDGEDGGEAWGWGDDTDAAAAHNDAPAQASKPMEPPNGGDINSGSKGRELTLRETYVITGTPQAVLELIVQLVEDAETLSQPNFSTSLIGPAAIGLFSIPTLILAMYRALGTTQYSHEEGGNMYLYNDSLYLAEQLRIFSAVHATHGKGRLRLDADLNMLEGYGKRAYGKEMDAQRLILKDLLDGAQDFVNCTAEPFASACDTGVTSVVDRIRAVNEQWRQILSPSARLQSLGSLLATVTSSMIRSIEDLGDISEPESIKLAALCNRVANLEDLFLPTTDADADTDVGAAAAPRVPLTAVYTPSWLKFQYLGNILEGSLADIRYLWVEGELRLEFEKDEMVELVEALFADSEHRRRAIADIRRGSAG